MRNYEVVPADESLDGDDVDVWLATRRRSWIVRNFAAVSLVVGVAGMIAAVAFKLRYDAAVSSRTGAISGLESRIENLQAEQTSRRVDLEAIQQSINDSRAELVAARRQVQQSQCDATNARLDADVTVRQVTCYKEVADYYLCDAKNQEAKADGTMFGTLIGAGLALATGGGSLLVVGGAVVGAAGSSNDGCPAVQCELDRSVIESTVLREHGLAQRSSCDDAGRT